MFDVFDVFDVLECDDLLSGNNSICVVDSVMGSGKTTAAINYINEMPDSYNFMFVTPYLSEVERIKAGCHKEVYEPHYEDNRKLYGLRSLIKENKNIVTTHALFKLLETEDIFLLKERNYICFIDEALTCISPYEQKLNTYDIDYMMEKLVRQNEETKMLEWIATDYGNGRFDEEMWNVKNNRLLYCDDVTLLQIFPIDILKAFKQVFVLTYLFEGSIMACYLKYFNVKYTYLYITGDDMSSVTFTNDETLKRVPDVNYSDLIHILDNPKMNMIGNGYYDLSVNWYNTRATQKDLTRLSKNMVNVFQNIFKVKPTECLWTTFSSHESSLSKGRYKKCYAPVNMKASNDWSDRIAVAYLVNRFMNLKITSFFTGNGVSIDQDLFATSEMIQFIWRSAIRNDHPIDLYIPSIRMRELLENWISENS